MAAQRAGIRLKKAYGQHFLQDTSVIASMIAAVSITPSSSLLEIGCGQGVLTGALLATGCARVRVYEIDPEWADYVYKQFPDPRLEMILGNVLDADFSVLQPHAPWILLANLPYQVSFPIMYKVHENRHLFQEGVVMLQEEVAQKIVKKSGKGYGFPALYFQYYFDLKLLNKVPPGSFYPPPKVFSRLLYFKPKVTVEPIVQEEQFWKFIKLCFAQPRRMLHNNLKQAHFDLSRIPERYLTLRAQQMHISDFLEVWQLLHSPRFS
jgi:16S rRNA (adenine1518-N6/adenine1519-N6)-dimethyltransferase